jgi:acyl-CoA synthetase (AMP-forming)/AMP-acid ligase II
MSLLQDKAREALQRDPSEPAIEFQGRRFDRGEIRRVADAVNRRLDESGAHPRAAVVLIGRTRPSALAALLGLVAGGRNIQMVYPFQSAAGIAHNIERLRPAVVVAAEEDFSEEARTALSALGAAGVVIEEMDARFLPGFERTALPFEPVPGPGPEPRIGVLTSGTTGPPKQFPLSYETLSKMPLVRHAASTPSGAPTLLYFPLGNISGLYTYLPALLGDQPMMLLDRFNLEAWRDYVRRYKPENFGLPASGIQMLMDADVPKAELATIRTMSTGAAPVDPTVVRAFQDRYGIPVLSSYGATEFSGPVTAMTPQLYEAFGEAKFGSVGRPLGDAQLRVVDAETGEPLPPGQEGLLEVISPRVGPGWIRTADLGVIDEDGFIFIRGRVDGAIIRGGFKVLPETIERALMLHPALSGVVVVGVPDRRLGQVPGAAVQLKPGVEPPGVEALEAHLRQQVLATHIPVHWRLVEELPRNASFKYDRQAVIRLFAEPA